MYQLERNRRSRNTIGDVTYGEAVGSTPGLKVSEGHEIDITSSQEGGSKHTAISTLLHTHEKHTHTGILEPT